MVMGVQSKDYLWDPAFRTLAGIAPGTYTLETVLNAAAYIATWCREQFGEAGPGGVAGQEMEAAAARLPIGAEGLLTLPYWNAAQTPHWDALARGATIGWHGRHTHAHLYRSILEGVGFELRQHLERLEVVTGQRIESIRAVGGGARSPLWIRIVTDITQRSVRVCAADEVSAAGAAALAWEFLDRGQASTGVAPSALPVGRDVSPDPSTATGYDALFAVYRRMYPSLRGLFPDLAAAADVIAAG